MNNVSKLDVWSHIETIQPCNRLVLLGASNLTRAFPMVVRLARERLEGPLSIHCAMGFGRSYGQESRFLTKKNLGIFLCGIWNAIEQEKKLPTTAIITDIGNDLAYEVPVQRIVEWVEGCIERLETHEARVVISDLPLGVLHSVSESRYRVFRTLLFPFCRLSWREMLQRAELLSQRLQTLAKAKQIPLFIGDDEFYGWDPIHPKREFLHRIYCDLFDCAGVSTRASITREKLLFESCYLRGLQPEKWTSLWFSRSASQPNGRLIDGTTISMY